MHTAEEQRLYLQECFQKSYKSPCQKMRFAAIVFSTDDQTARGVNGWYSMGMGYHPVECDPCLRTGVPSGTRLELCRATHAEQYAIAIAARQGFPLRDGTLYCAGTYPDGRPHLKKEPGFYCTLCARAIALHQIAHVITPMQDRDDPTGWRPVVLSRDRLWEFAYGVAQQRINALGEELDQEA